VLATVNLELPLDAVFGDDFLELELLLDDESLEGGEVLDKDLPLVCGLDDSLVFFIRVVMSAE